MHIILGTAQLTPHYGLKRKKLNLKDLTKIILHAKKKKNFYIDTSIHYKNVDKALSKLNLESFKIITKIKNENNKDFYKKIIRNKKKLNIKVFDTILSHDEKNLIGKKSKNTYNQLNNLKKQNVTKKIGVSVYTVKGMHKIIDKYKIDAIEIPVSIFDRRFLQKKILKKLKSLKIKVFARSVFLQGTLLDKKLFYKIAKNKNYLVAYEEYEKWLLKKNLTNLTASLNFLHNFKIKNPIIGFVKYKEYKEVSDFKKYYRIKNYPNFIKNQSDNNYLLRPDMWKR